MHCFTFSPDNLGLGAGGFGEVTIGDIAASNDEEVCTSISTLFTPTCCFGVLRIVSWPVSTPNSVLTWLIPIGRPRDFLMVAPGLDCSQ